MRKYERALPTPPRHKPNISIGWVLSFPLIIQVAIVGIIGSSSIHHTQRSVDLMVSQLRDQITKRVENEVANVLDDAKQLNNIIAQSIEAEQVNLDQIRSLENVYWSHITTFNTINGLGFGNSSGDLMALFRQNINGSTIYYLEYTSLETDKDYVSLALDSERQILESKIYEQLIDPRERPWYEIAVFAGNLVWTDVYLSVSKSTENPALLMNMSQPIYNNANQLEGVVSVILDLQQISGILQNTEVSPSGYVYIIEPTGELISSSDEQKPLELVNGEVERLWARESSTPLIQASALYLDQHFQDDLSRIHETQQLDFLAQGTQRQVLQVTPISDPYGLEWLIVVVIPEADFLTPIYTNIRIVIGLCLAALVTVIALRFLIFHWITDSVKRLTQTASLFSAGNLTQRASQGSTIHEIQLLANSFNEMAQRLQSSFVVLQESETKFRTIAESLPGAIIRYSLHPDGSEQVSYLSPGSEELWEVQSEEVARNPQILWHLVHPDDVSGMQASVEESARTLKPWYYTWRITTLITQQEKWVQGSGNPVQHENGEIVWTTVIFDISDRKKVEQVQLEFKLLEDVLNLVLAGYWELDLAHQRQYLSPGYKRMLGYEDWEMDNESWQQLVFPEDLSVIETSFQKHVQSRGQIPFYTEVRFRHKNGSAVWVIHSGQAIEWDHNHQPLRVIGCHIDITQRKQAEIALRESEQRYLTLSEAAPVAICRFDHEGSCVYVNSRWCDMTGYPLEAALGFGWLKVVHPDDQDRLLKEWTEAVAAGRSNRGEIRHLCPDGSIVWCYYQALPERNEEGRVTGYIGTLTDITERKHAEELLLKSETHLKTAQRIGKLGSWEYIPQIGHITWSEEVFEIFGLSPQEGEPSYAELANFFHPEDADYHHQTVQTAIQNKSSYDIQCRIYRPNGNLVYIAARGEPIFDQRSGHLLLFVGTVQDITEHKQIEAQLQQLTTQLKLSNQELEQFAYVASHDLQEPLRAVTSFAQLLAKRYQNNLDKKGNMYIDLIVDGANRMQAQIRALLAYSRVGRQTLHLKVVDCSQLLAQVKQDLRIAISETQAQITSDLLPTVTADSTQLTHLFQNLISNALKYRSAVPPMIHISVILPDSPLHLKPHPPDSPPSEYRREWIFSVQDNGIGIDPQYSERIFGIFQRLHTSDEYSGTGLGLTICQRIVERHGGRIWVNSKLGQGATFYFTLPSIQET